MCRRKGFEHMSVDLQLIGPEILAHKLPRVLQPLLNEGQGHLGGGGIGHHPQRDVLGFLESLHKRARQIAVLLQHVLAHTEQMHDRKHAVPPIPFGGCGHRIRP
jgi:hypothetical protein